MNTKTKAFEETINHLESIISAYEAGTQYSPEIAEACRALLAMAED